MNPQRKPLPILLILLCFSACQLLGRKTHITHMAFLDAAINSSWKQVDPTNTTTPIVERTLYYRIDTSDASGWKPSFLEKFIADNDSIQKEIHRNYPHLYIDFYRRSGNTDSLLLTQSADWLTKCETDLVANFTWENGKLTLSHYSNF